MDSREKKELFNRLEKATNNELGQICLNMLGKDPFKSSLLLPSVIRTTTIGALKELITQGKLKVEKGE